MAASKTTTPGSTTVKVSTNTGAAKDDIFTGLTEDSASTNLNVLANDPGSAKIWSLDQNALKALAGSQQPQELSAYTLASGARISLNTDGTVRYEGAAALQSLAEGELFNDSFIYTIRMANGALSTATATVAITGVNDAATFAGDKTGTLTEDAAATSDTLLVSDIDHDQSSMQASAQTGAFGALTLNTAGAWNYQRTSDMNYLQQGESVAESFTVRSLDGTAQNIDVTITGVNDVAVFGGTASGTVQEDGVLSTGGVVTVSDLDHDQSAFAATGSLAGTYGDFNFNLGTGAWTYVLRNADTNVQALSSGQSVQDKLQITSVDGTASELAVTIGGQNEAVITPPAANPSEKWTVNKNNVTQTGGGLHVSFENGVAKISGFDSNDTLHFTSLDKDAPFIQLIDTDNNSTLDSTLLNFSYEQGRDVNHIDVILVGYTGFSDAQLFLDK
jgi:VCBS repeat-containing protein